MDRTSGRIGGGNGFRSGLLTGSVGTGGDYPGPPFDRVEQPCEKSPADSAIHPAPGVIASSWFGPGVVLPRRGSVPADPCLDLERPAQLTARLIRFAEE
jgi:hypothetical protein